jgi:hypothetical protein
MISPNLHDIWVMFFLNLSQKLKLVLLLYFGTLAMAIHCRAVKNSTLIHELKLKEKTKMLSVTYEYEPAKERIGGQWYIF